MPISTMAAGLAATGLFLGGESPCLYRPAPARPTTVKPIAATALENLEGLEAATGAFREAERLREAGESDRAACHYERVRTLAPGSRYDALAADALYALRVWREKSATEAGGEEQETNRVPPRPIPEDRFEVEVRKPLVLEVLVDGHEEAEAQPPRAASGRFSLTLGGACLEVDRTRPATPRWRFDLQFGPVRIELGRDR